MSAAQLPPIKMSQILPERLARWAPQFRAASSCYGVDPYVLAAIVDRESLGGEALHPRGPTGKGDHGKGHGLAQIDSGSHGSFLCATFDDGLPLWSDPTFNIIYAARLLRRNLAILDDYPAAIGAHNAGATRVRRALVGYEHASQAVRIPVINAVTKDGDYVTDVLRRRANFIGATEDAIPDAPGALTDA